MRLLPAWILAALATLAACTTERMPRVLEPMPLRPGTPEHPSPPEVGGANADFKPGPTQAGTQEPGPATPPASPPVLPTPQTAPQTPQDPPLPQTQPQPPSPEPLSPQSAPENPVLPQSPGPLPEPPQLPSPPATTQPIEPTPVVLGDVPLDENRNLVLGAPHDRRGRPEIRISRDEYVISWNPSLRALNWVAWTVEPSDLGSSGRTDVFSVDDDLSAYMAENGGYAVQADELSGSCFDRGHQVPSGDRTASAAHNAMTFEMSNIIPQAAYMNRVPWAHLEERERSLAKQSGGRRVFVVAGGIYGDAPTFVGKYKNIAVAARNFKIIVVLPSGGTASDVNASTTIVAVSMPNVTSTGSDARTDRAQACADSKNGDIKPSAGSPDDWHTYRTTLGAIEAESGFDLLPAVSAAAHAALATKASGD